MGSETKKHAKFAFVLKIILTLSHGQAAVGRGFSLGKSSLQINITEESIVAKKIVEDHLQDNKVNISSYNVPNKLVLSCNSAHARYKASLQEKANEAKKSVQKEKRELFQEELNELINKEKKLIGTCDS